MPRTLQPTGPEGPLFIRWIPEECPFALELRLDMLSVLKSELEDAENRGVESGGVLLGTLPSPDLPTLRVEELILIPRRPGALPEYHLELEQLNRLSEITVRARLTDRRAVGFFRNHLRQGPLSPSEADIGMLSRQFAEGLYAFLIVDSQTRQGAFYLAINGDLAEVPSTDPFPLEEEFFRMLPEVAAETTKDVRNFGMGRAPARRPLPWAAIASLAILVFLVGVWTFGSRISQMFRPASNQIDLSVMSYGTNLKITWDHSSPVIFKAVSATVVILDGTAHREVRLDADDLRLGQIAYERLTRKVYVVMRLDAPGLKLTPQTFDWTGD